MTFKKFKFSNKDIQLREAELELVTLLSNLSRCKTKSENKNSRHGRTSIKYVCYEGPVRITKHCIDNTGKGLDPSLRLFMSFRARWKYRLVHVVHWRTTMFAPSIYINKTIVLQTLKKNYGRFINQENFPPRQL